VRLVPPSTRYLHLAFWRLATKWLHANGTNNVPADTNMRILFDTVDGKGIGPTVGGLEESDITGGIPSANIVSFEVGNASGTAMVIPDNMDTNPTMPGRQFKFDVFTKLPVDTIDGVYNTVYTIDTN